MLSVSANSSATAFAEMQPADPGLPGEAALALSGNDHDTVHSPEKRCAVMFKIVFQELLDAYVSSYRAKDAAACASVYAPDGKLFSPFGPPAIGRRAIEATHRDWVEDGAENKEIRVVDAGGSGDVAWCLAHFSEGSTGSGTSLNILERQPDGAWLITHCSLNLTIED